MTKFSEFGLAEPILRAIDDLGFTEASPIQQKTIPLLTQEETDIIGLAQTGTGKTAAFGLPLLQSLQEDNARNIQGLIISPTRELCIQLEEEIVKYSKYLPFVKSVAVYGGTPITGQIRDIKRHRPQIIVATPGRLIDLINRGVIHLDQVHTVVLDEADEMLNMGFREDIESILSTVPENRQVWLFSATMNKDVRRIASRFMNSPQEISVAAENVGNENIKHQYFVINHHQRYDALKRLLDLVPDIYGIVFTRTKRDAQEVSEKLMREGYLVSPLHGDMDQNMRSKVMERFKSRSLQVIVATDVAARGIDVNDISHVINYELPEDPEIYTHRSGRTGRAGRSGICMSLVTPREMGRLRQVERLAKTRFEKQMVPDGSQVVDHRIHAILDEIVSSEPQKDFINLEDESIAEKLGAFSSEELIEKLLWMQLKQTIQTYKNARDLNAGGGSRERGSDERRGDSTSTRMYFNLGTKDGMDPGSLVALLADSADLDSKTVSRITVRELSSFFNIPNESVDLVTQALKGQTIKGRTIRIEEADNKPQGGGGRPRFDSPRSGGGREGRPPRGAYGGGGGGGGGKFDNKRRGGGRDSAQYSKSRKQPK